MRNRLKYALNKREVTAILAQRLIKVDGQVRTDSNYPAGFQGNPPPSPPHIYRLTRSDVITIDKTSENFRLVYDVKGRFTIHRITAEEAKYKLGKVKRVQLGKAGVPYLVTHDARTIHYPDPAIKVGDTIRFDLETSKITGYIKFDIGNIAMITAGNNIGRVGVVTHRERHHGGYDIVHIKDAQEHTFATREGNVFIIGEGNKPWISLPKGRGIKLSIAEGILL
jgi:small subunit ribosomal protein S4e